MNKYCSSATKRHVISGIEIDLSGLLLLSAKEACKNSFIIALFLVLLSSSAQAQNDSGKPPLYVSNELGFGNFLSNDLSLNTSLNTNYNLKFGYIGNIRTPESLPKDFSSGLLGLTVFSLGKRPYDRLRNLYVSVGRYFPLDKRGVARFNFSMGLGYTMISKPSNWIKNNNVLLKTNYNWTEKRHSTVSLIINPKIEIQLTRIFGFSISPLIQLNNDLTYYGVGFGMILGRL